MRRVEDHLRVRVERVERGVRWALEQYRSQGARALVNRARSAAAQLLTPADPASARSRTAPSPPQLQPQPQRPAAPAGGSPDVLAGMCAGVALRDLNLVDSLLAQLEDMEANEGDPEALARLYQLDHLAARLRRNAENLRVLAGHEAGGAAEMSAPLVDVLRAAMSAIEQYPRVEIGRVAALAVVDFAADDLSRLLAELLDNATSHSPPTSKVTVSAHLTERGSVLLRIEDAGIGLPPERLQVLNARLADPPTLDSDTIEHMGLAVVRRLSAKHGIRVRLDRRATHGTTAVVLLPASLVCEAPSTPWFSESPTMRIPRVAPAPVRVRASPPPSPRSSTEWMDPADISPTAISHTAETTRNGLPRRVPRSLREFAHSAAPSPPDDPDPRQGREQLMADLGDFSAGERAAREVLGAGPGAETEQKEPGR